MWQLILIYKWTMVAGVVTAAALSILGSHLAARDKSMQTLCIGQGATLGVLFGIGLLPYFTQIEWIHELGPFISAIVLSGLTYFWSEKLVAKRSASKNTHFTAIFIILLATGYMVSSAFPALESHMAQAFFGDLATMTDRVSAIVLILAVFTLLFLTLQWKRISNQSFELAIFGQRLSGHHRRIEFFDILVILVLSFSIQFVGFIFTVACLFVPTFLFHRLKLNSLKTFLRSIAVVAALGCLMGFFISLFFTMFPTVPTIVLTMVVLGLLTVLTMNRANQAAGPKLP